MLSLSLALLAIPALFVAVFTTLAPVVQTYITSGLMWVANKGFALMKGWPAWTQTAVLGVIGLLVAYGANLIGFTVSGNPESWTVATAQGLAQAAVAHFIYNFGKHPEDA